MKSARLVDIIARVDTKKAGRLGGERRAKNMTPEQRSEAASQAVRARWAKTTPEERSEAARKAVTARWAKVRKPKK